MKTRDLWFPIRKKKHLHSDFTVTFFVDKKDSHLLKSIERNFREILKANFGQKISAKLFNEGTSFFYDNLDDIQVFIYVKNGYRIYDKTLMEVLGNHWAYAHEDWLSDPQKIQCYEKGLWWATSEEDCLVHPAVVGIKFFDIRDVDFSRKELIPIPWLKAGRREPEVPLKITFIQEKELVSKIVFPENLDDLCSTDTIRVWCE